VSSIQPVLTINPVQPVLEQAYSIVLANVEYLFAAVIEGGTQKTFSREDAHVTRSFVALSRLPVGREDAKGP
jgi:hypothetical protein